MVGRSRPNSMVGATALKGQAAEAELVGNLAGPRNGLGLV